MWRLSRCSLQDETISRSQSWNLERYFMNLQHQLNYSMTELCSLFCRCLVAVVKEKPAKKKAKSKGWKLTWISRRIIRYSDKSIHLSTLNPHSIFLSCLPCCISYHFIEKKKAAPASSEVSTQCPKHNEEVATHFCLTCSKPLCGVCTTQLVTKAKHEHIGHTLKTLAEARETVVKELENKLTQVSNRT